MNQQHEQGLQRLVDFYEKLKPETIVRLERVYDDNASFRDPFNDVRGAGEIRRVLDDMFKHLTDVKFKIIESARQDEKAFLIWDMAFRMKSRPATLHNIHGASHIHLDPSGKVTLHRDYWDAGEEVYEKVPVLGALIRLVKKRIG